MTPSITSTILPSLSTARMSESTMVSLMAIDGPESALIEAPEKQGQLYDSGNVVWV